MMFKECLFTGKTAVSFLIERCTARQLSLPTFAGRAATSGRGFECVVTVSGYRYKGETVQGDGVARTKKEAKQKAAGNVLELLGYDPDVIQPKSLNQAIQNTVEISPYDPTDGSNVQKLEFFCNAHSYRIPIYEETKQEGISHAPRFYVRCRVRRNDGTEVEVEDFANSKKRAKIKAAITMRQTLEAEILDQYSFPNSVQSSSAPSSGSRNSTYGRTSSGANSSRRSSLSSEFRDRKGSWGRLADFDVLMDNAPRVRAESLKSPFLSFPNDVSSAVSTDTDDDTSIASIDEEYASSQSPMALRIFCGQKSFPAPVFKETDEGPAHRRNFICECSVAVPNVKESKVIKVVECGTRKKTAKILAAKTMLEHLKEYIQEKILLEDKDMRSLARFLKARQVQYPKVNQVQPAPANEIRCHGLISHQHLEYQCLEGPLITSLRESLEPDSEDSEEVLSRVGTEENFETYYQTTTWDPDRRPSRQQCYLTLIFCPSPDSYQQLISPPSPVFMAEGRNERRARQEAAREAISFLITVSQGVE